MQQTLLAAAASSCRRSWCRITIDWRESLPRNPNGKYDRAELAAEFKDLFAEDAA